MNVTAIANLIISVVKGQQVIPCITIAISVAASATVTFPLPDHSFSFKPEICCHFVCTCVGAFE
jgi:hypothetical protein